MKIFVCIDDTDNLDSIGTGELLENMMCEASLNNLCSSGMTVRYQLFIHDDIPYTSHNSSMCCNAQTDNLDALTKFCEDYLEANSAEGSDPGLCILTDDDSLDYTPLIDFGKRAQREVLAKDEAYSTALAFGKDVHLSEHGGTGGGVIGALAGAALRAGKEEGRIKGKLQPVPGKTEWSADEFSKMFGVQSFTDEEGREIKEPLSFVFMHPTKLIYRGGLVTAVIVNENGRLMPKPKIKKAKK
ncbi:MAG: hypothetical protein IJM02_04890 [Clostridia bacterium]|nr:hypothetical protein [Clostridia bacterium]